MKLRQFQINRATISIEALDQYRGKWVAVSADGRRIVAAHEDLAELDALIVAAGEDPEAVALEFIETDDNFVAGAESF